MDSLSISEQAVKATYVSQIQDRHVDIDRASNQAQLAFNEELARKAEEVVEETEEAGQQIIREDEEKGHSQQEKKRRRRNPDEPEEDELLEDWPMGPDDDGKPHSLNIIA